MTADPTSGRRVVVTDFGGPDVLDLVPTTFPAPGAGEVRLRVRVAGLNPVDWKIFAGGATAERFGVRPPFGNGNDFAGEIDAVGAGVAGWAIGDRVYGGARFHAQADHVLVSDLCTLNRTPDALSDSLAGVLDIAGRTALAGIAALELTPSDTVLVSAAAGGVGVLAAQLAVRSGARVLGTASPGNHALLADLGVEAVDYHGDLGARLVDRGITAVFDGQGRETIDLAFALGVPAQRINSVADAAVAKARGATSVGRATTSTSAIAEVADLVVAGDLRLGVEEIDLGAVRSAYGRLMAGHTCGKLALRVSSPEPKESL